MSRIIQYEYKAKSNKKLIPVSITISNLVKGYVRNKWIFLAVETNDYFESYSYDECVKHLYNNYYDIKEIGPTVKIIMDEHEEQDPTGLASSEPGAKLDAGKIRADLLLDFSRALSAVAEVSDFGARKYSPGGWQYVQDGITRYRAAQLRHMLAGREVHDKDSGLLHLAHEAWNALAVLELTIRKNEKPCGVFGERGLENKSRQWSNNET